MLWNQLSVEAPPPPKKKKRQKKKIIEGGAKNVQHMFV